MYFHAAVALIQSSSEPSFSFSLTFTDLTLPASSMTSSTCLPWPRIVRGRDHPHQPAGDGIGGPGSQFGREIVDIKRDEVPIDGSVLLLRGR